MFALVAWEEIPLRITLKCDPDHALALRDIYAAGQPGYHMHTVILDGSIPQDEMLGMIDHSYALVVKGLKKSVRQALQE